jgi:hypothetical protein
MLASGHMGMLRVCVGYMPDVREDLIGVVDAAFVAFSFRFGGIVVEET